MSEYKTCEEIESYYQKQPGIEGICFFNHPTEGELLLNLIYNRKCPEDPSQILIQHIGDYRSERLAEIYGKHMQQTAAKDSRGTQKVNKNAYNINNN